MRIAVDAMGGDNAPQIPVEGALVAARRLGASLLLIGREDAVRAELERYPHVDRLDIELRHAPDVVSMAEPPAAALRRKPQSSIRVAVEAVARGEADAVFSAGNTGASVVATHAAFGMLPEVDRPALAATIPTRTGAAVLLDSGATVDCRPLHLLQFASMGCVFARVALEMCEPRVGLLSVGEEDSKGNDLTREAHRLLRGAHLNFVGNVDARAVYTGQADVIVCDGFTGNVALKVSEGLVDTIESMLEEELSRTFSARFGLLLSRRAFRRFRRRVDYSEYGGAPLLGVAGLCVVGHGRSSAKAVRNGIAMTHRFAQLGLLDRMRAEISSMAAPSAAGAPARGPATSA
jgi:glycerol-3-phosphate acyltransferase PlsX